MAWMNKSSLHVLVALFFIILNVNAKKSCVTVSVRADYYQLALKSMNSFQKVINWNLEFKNNYEEIAGSASVSGKYLFVSASTKASFQHITSKVSHTQGYSYSESGENITFSDNYVQIKEKITTKVTINGIVATSTEESFIESIHTKHSLCCAQKRAMLKKRATDYIQEYFGNDGGKISGQTYTETKCIEVKSWKCKCVSPNRGSPYNGITCEFSSASRPSFSSRKDFYCEHWQKCRNYGIVDGAEIGLTNYGDFGSLEDRRFMQRKLKCNADYCDDYDDPADSSWCL